MKTLKQITLLVVTVISAVWFALPSGLAQESMLSGAFPQPASPKEKLQALQLTRFHFITLKQFHAALFTFGGEQNAPSNSDAEILNAGLNAFLSSPGRETALLEALRQNKAIRLLFSIPEEEKNSYEVASNPNRSIAYRLEPVVRRVPASVEIRPLLDRPVAFQITITKGNEHYSYYVDWAGKITCAA